MLKFKTTKAVLTDLHSAETNLIEFQFSYTRDDRGLLIKVVPYSIGEYGELTEIPGARTKRQLTIDGLSELLTASQQITEVDENSLVYLDNLIANGIKIVITTDGLWQNKLAITDFE